MYANVHFLREEFQFLSPQVLWLNSKTKQAEIFHSTWNSSAISRQLNQLDGNQLSPFLTLFCFLPKLTVKYIMDVRTLCIAIYIYSNIVSAIDHWWLLKLSKWWHPYKLLGSRHRLIDAVFSKIMKMKETVIDVPTRPLCLQQTVYLSSNLSDRLLRLPSVTVVTLWSHFRPCWV